LGPQIDPPLKIETLQLMAGAAVLSSATYVPILARDYLGADEPYVSIVVGAYATASFVASYVFGRAGDIYGRRLILRGGLLASFLSFGLLLVTNGLESLFIVRILNGFCIGIYPGALTAYASERKMPMGRYSSFGALGWAAGTLLAGYAAGFEIHLAFLASTVFLAGALASAIALPPIPAQHMRIPLFPVEIMRRNLSVYVAMLIRNSSASAVWTLWPLFLADLGGDDFAIGIVQALNSTFQVIFMIALTDRLGHRLLVLLGLLSSAATFGMLMLATNIMDVLPSQIVLGFAWSCLYVGSLKCVTETNDEKSTASGLLQSVIAVSGVIGPMIAAILYAIWPSYFPILFNAFVMSIISFIIFGLTGPKAPELTKTSLIAPVQS
jgi:MFS family permease